LHYEIWFLVALWIYSIKFGLNGKIGCLKSKLVAEGYTQIYDLDWCDTFSPITKLTGEIYWQSG